MAKIDYAKKQFNALLTPYEGRTLLEDDKTKLINEFKKLLRIHAEALETQIETKQQFVDRLNTICPGALASTNPSGTPPSVTSTPETPPSTPSNVSSTPSESVTTPAASAPSEQTQRRTTESREVEGIDEIGKILIQLEKNPETEPENGRNILTQGRYGNRAWAIIQDRRYLIPDFAKAFEKAKKREPIPLDQSGENALVSQTSRTEGWSSNFFYFYENGWFIESGKKGGESEDSYVHFGYYNNTTHVVENEITLSDDEMKEVRKIGDDYGIRLRGLQVSTNPQNTAFVYIHGEDGLIVYDRMNKKIQTTIFGTGRMRNWRDIGQRGVKILQGPDERTINGGVGCQNGFLVQDPDFSYRFIEIHGIGKIQGYNGNALLRGEEGVAFAQNYDPDPATQNPDLSKWQCIRLPLIGEVAYFSSDTIHPDRKNIVLGDSGIAVVHLARRGSSQEPLQFQEKDLSEEQKKKYSELFEKLRKDATKITSWTQTETVEGTNTKHTITITIKENGQELSYSFEFIVTPDTQKKALIDSLREVFAARQIPGPDMAAGTPWRGVYLEGNAIKTSWLDNWIMPNPEQAVKIAETPDSFSLEEIRQNFINTSDLGIGRVIHFYISGSNKGYILGKWGVGRYDFNQRKIVGIYPLPNPSEIQRTVGEFTGINAPASPNNPNIYIITGHYDDTENGFVEYNTQTQQYSVHPEIGYIRTQQNLGNDTILGENGLMTFNAQDSTYTLQQNGPDINVIGELNALFPGQQNGKIPACVLAEKGVAYQDKDGAWHNVPLGGDLEYFDPASQDTNGNCIVFGEETISLINLRTHTQRLFKIPMDRRDTYSYQTPAYADLSGIFRDSPIHKLTADEWQLDSETEILTVTINNIPYRVHLLPGSDNDTEYEENSQKFLEEAVKKLYIFRRLSDHDYADVAAKIINDDPQIIGTLEGALKICKAQSAKTTLIEKIISAAADKKKKVISVLLDTLGSNPDIDIASSLGNMPHIISVGSEWDEDLIQQALRKNIFQWHMDEKEPSGGFISVRSELDYFKPDTVLYIKNRGYVKFQDVEVLGGLSITDPKIKLDYFEYIGGMVQLKQTSDNPARTITAMEIENNNPQVVESILRELRGYQLTVFDHPGLGQLSEQEKKQLLKLKRMTIIENLIPYAQNKKKTVSVLLDAIGNDSDIDIASSLGRIPHFIFSGLVWDEALKRKALEKNIFQWRADNKKPCDEFSNQKVSLGGLDLNTILFFNGRYEYIRSIQVGSIALGDQGVNLADYEYVGETVQKKP